MTGSLLPKHPANPPVITTPIPGPQDLCAIMFTSGTTGPAKGVMVTHLMLELSARAVAHLSETRDGDVFFMWEPFFHIGGAQVIVMPFLFPITLALQDRFSASRFWDQVRDCGATQIHHLGGIIQILLKQPRNAHDKDHKVRICWGGGCAPSAWRPFEDRFGVRIRECYGMTEASSITTYNDRGVVGSVGAAVPWFNVTLQNPEGRALGPDEGRGEIVVITNLPGAIFGGYYRNPEATAKALRPDGFYTGDVGSWDADGLMYFHGRMSDSVRCRGENVSAHEVESVAGRHSDVEDCAMVGVPAEIGEQDILLFIQLAAGTNPDPAAISAWLERQLPPYQRPRFIAFVESFERTPSQRIKKHFLPMDSAIRWDREHQSEP
jgi:crotonobetaine/carnitine-CoA ligase